MSRKLACSIVVVLCLGWALYAQTPPIGAMPAGQSGSAPLALKIGDKAPEFELTDHNNNKVRLADFRGKKNVVLAFYVFAFTGG